MEMRKSNGCESLMPPLMDCGLFMDMVESGGGVADIITTYFYLVAGHQPL